MLYKCPVIPPGLKHLGTGPSSLQSFYVIPKLCHSVSKSVTGHAPSRITQQTVLRPLPFAETLKSCSSPHQRNTQCQCTANVWELSFWGWYLRADTFRSEDLKDLFQSDLQAAVSRGSKNTCVEHVVLLSSSAPENCRVEIITGL